MYYRPRGTPSFVIYILVVLFTLILGLFLGASYPDQINQFFPSLRERVVALLEQELTGGGQAPTPLPLEGGGPDLFPFTPVPTQVFVPVNGDSSLLPPRPTPRVCIVSTGSALGTVNIRSGPGANFPVIGTAREGDRITLSGPEDEDGWAPILTDGGLGGYFYLPSWCN